MVPSPWHCPCPQARGGTAPCPALPCVTHTPPLFELPGDVCEQDAGGRDVGTACSRGLAMPSDSGEGAQPSGLAVTQALVTVSLRDEGTAPACPRQLPAPPARRVAWSTGMIPAPAAGALRQGLAQPSVPWSCSSAPAGGTWSSARSCCHRTALERHFAGSCWTKGAILLLPAPSWLSFPKTPGEGQWGGEELPLRAWCSPASV